MRIQHLICLLLLFSNQSFAQNLHEVQEDIENLLLLGLRPVSQGR
jgi:hypothetical protein